MLASGGQPPPWIRPWIVVRPSRCITIFNETLHAFDRHCRPNRVVVKGTQAKRRKVDRIAGMVRRGQPLPPPSYTGTKVKVDQSHMPLIRVFAKVIEEWKEDEAGDIFQIEAEVHNQDSKTVPDFYIEISPPDCVQSIWNLAKMKDGVYRLLGFWTGKGGLEADKSMSWGMLATTPTPTLTVKPKMDPEAKTEEASELKQPEA